MTEVGLSIRKIANMNTREIDKRVSTLGISAQQGRVIGYIYQKSKKRDVFQKDIEEAFELRGASVSSLLQNMEKHNLIKRESVEFDQRLKKLVLTEDAISMHQRIKSIIADVEAQVFRALDNEELEFLDGTLKKILEKNKMNKE